MPWTHRLALKSAAKGAPLTLELTVDKGQIDVNEGYDLVIDHGQALRVPPEAIKMGAGKNDYLLNDDLNDTVIQDLAGGGNLIWKYVNAEDKSPASAQLSSRYISGRQLPDKAVDLLDTAAARVKIARATKPEQVDDIERRLQALVREQQALRSDAAMGGVTMQHDRVRIG